LHVRRERKREPKISARDGRRMRTVLATTAMKNRKGARILSLKIQSSMVKKDGRKRLVFPLFFRRVFIAEKNPEN
jgi:hypothetical protein